MQEKHLTTLPPPPPRPSKSGYSLYALLKAPGRLLRPPVVIAQNPQGLGDKTVLQVRGATRMKLKDLTLDDLLTGKLLPPLSLKDFEEYLSWVEHSAENLYFRAFYKEYHEFYHNSAKVGGRSPADKLALRNAYHLSIQAFFDSSSPLELNVADNLRRQLEQDHAALSQLGEGEDQFLSPDKFEKVYDQTIKSLEHSFRKWLVYSVRNAERNRGIFAKVVGAVTLLVGLIPTIVCTILGENRGWRALGIPFWWLGTVVFIGGWQHTCLVAYLFGDHRQLRPWELIRESSASSSTSLVPSYSPVFDGDLEKGHGVEASTGTHTPTTTFGSRPTSFDFSAYNYFPVAKSEEELSDSSPSKIIYYPAVVSPSLSSSSPVWASLTEISEPLVKRAQWETIVTAALYGLCATIVLTAICLSVPNRR
ncbi:hypothetical protein P7C70_g3491, partial [Phenoliferia sp. Uapishka_3]